VPPSVCRLALLLVGAASFSQVQAGPADACARHAAASKPAVNLRLDNDVFGAQDQGYSSGIQLMLVSSDLGDGSLEDGRPGDRSRAGNGCRWPLTDWLGRRLRFLAPAGSVQRNLTFSFGQAIFTPSNPKRTDLIPEDRPYAAALLVGLGHNARRDGRLHASLVQVGMIGPSARGEPAQDQIHKLTGDAPFLGWEHQLRDEAVFRVLHERLQRHLPRSPPAAVGSWRWDAVSHWGVSLGNLQTHANVGGEVRWGPALPDDFGSSPTRPAGERTIGRRGEGDSAFAAAPTGHAFVAVDARWVLWDISLDGNTFKSSHSVDKEHFVVDLGYGLAFTRGPWKIVLARFHRSHEFRGQKDMPIFGSISVSRSF
jgi:lipid A 3-O-deacylase